MRARREELGWSQEKVGVDIGIDESSSRARISRYESGVHEPPVQTAQAPIGEVLMVNLENEDPVYDADGVPFLATSYAASK